MFVLKYDINGFTLNLKYYKMITIIIANSITNLPSRFCKLVSGFSP